MLSGAMTPSVKLIVYLVGVIYWAGVVEKSTLGGTISLEGLS